jgi:16S rRNA (adenine1518-N6/adenine1519-N6)-dimethyltransferase
LLASHPKARVLAIEIDRGLASYIKEEFAEAIASQKLTLLEGDVLSGKHTLSPELVNAALEIGAAENRTRKVLCANLPYNVATPVLANLAADAQGIGVERAVATIQLELAERMFAPAGSDEYGGLSALISLRADGKILRRVGNEVFWPRPNVDSAVIRMDFKPWGANTTSGMKRDEAESFHQFLQRLFSQRRKMIRSVLKGANIPENLKISPDARAETLTPEQLLALFRATR